MPKSCCAEDKALKNVINGTISTLAKRVLIVYLLFTHYSQMRSIVRIVPREEQKKEQCKPCVRIRKELVPMGSNQAQSAT